MVPIPNRRIFYAFIKGITIGVFLIGLLQVAITKVDLQKEHWAEKSRNVGYYSDTDESFPWPFESDYSNSSATTSNISTQSITTPESTPSPSTTISSPTTKSTSLSTQEVKSTSKISATSSPSAETTEITVISREMTNSTFQSSTESSALTSTTPEINHSYTPSTSIDTTSPSATSSTSEPTTTFTTTSSEMINGTSHSSSDSTTTPPSIDTTIPTSQSSSTTEAQTETTKNNSQPTAITSPLSTELPASISTSLEPTTPTTVSVSSGTTTPPYSNGTTPLIPATSSDITSPAPDPTTSPEQLEHQIVTLQRQFNTVAGVYGGIGFIIVAVVAFNCYTIHSMKAFTKDSIQELLKLRRTTPKRPNPEVNETLAKRGFAKYTGNIQRPRSPSVRNRPQSGERKQYYGGSYDYQPPTNRSYERNAYDYNYERHPSRHGSNRNSLGTQAYERGNSYQDSYGEAHRNSKFF